MCFFRRFGISFERCKKNSLNKHNKGFEAALAVVSILNNGPKKI